MSNAITCSIDGCENTNILAKGWCNAHYKRWWRHGDPLAEIHRRCPGENPTHTERLEYIGWTERVVDPALDQPCWEWKGLFDRAGYGRLWDGNRVQAAHRLAYIAWVRPITSKELLLHACDNPPCINPDHLSVGTDRTNAADMVSKGRQANGELKPDHKLKDADVDAIRAAFTGERGQQAAIARQYGVSASYISMLVRGLARKNPTNWDTTARTVDAQRNVQSKYRSAA